MATITVRNLDPEVLQRLKERATANHRSMEAEAREILSSAVRVDTFMTDWLEIAADFRRRFGGVDLELPERTPLRKIDLS